MLTIEERIARSEEHITKLKQQKRIKERKEREAKKKKDQRHNYIIGKLVSKYFPEVLKVLNLEPGTKAENTITFEPLEVFLSVLSSEQILMKQLKEKTKLKILEANKKEESCSKKCSNV